MGLVAPGRGAAPPFRSGAAGLITPPPAAPAATAWETRLAHPDHWSAAPRSRTRGIVWHCTAGPGSNEGQYEGTIGWFRTPAAARRPAGQSSAHVVIGWDGSRGCVCVPLEARAFHVATAGYNAEWLGVELCRRAPIAEGPAWPDILWPRLAAWAVAQGRRFGFDAKDPACHVTHAQVQPRDRTDPGPWFRLDRLLDECRRIP